MRKVRDAHKPSAFKYHIAHKYGISMDAYNALCEVQNNKCKICGLPPKENEKLFVDHNHITGKVRGMLCQRCNFGLGWFDDNKKRLIRASKYLEETDG